MALVRAYLEHRRMEATASYLQRGRKFAELSETDVISTWASVFKLWAQTHHPHYRRERDDIDCELQLRQLAPPVQLVKREIVRIFEHDMSNDPEWLEEISQRAEAFWNLSKKTKN